MKTSHPLLHILLSIVFVAACGKPTEPVVVEFPSLKTISMERGGSAVIEFEAAVDWEANLTTESRSSFKIDDNGITGFSAKGKAGHVSIRIIASDSESFDVERTGALRLTMNSQTQEIAKMTIRADARIFDAFYGNVGQSEYTPWTSKLEMRWNSALMSYQIPVRISANFDWSISECPDWVLPEATSGRSGSSIDFRLYSDTHFMTEEPVSGIIKFMDVKTGTIAAQLELANAGYGNIVEVTIPETMEFNAPGFSYQDGSLSQLPFEGSFVGGRNARLEIESEGDWVELLTADWNLVDQALVQERKFSITASKNEGAARTAHLLAYGSSSKEGKVIATITQTEASFTIEWGYITPSYTAYQMALRGASFERVESDTDYPVYELKYNSVESNEYADLILEYSAASVDINTNSFEVLYPTDNDRVIKINRRSRGYDDEGEITFKDDNGALIALIRCSVNEDYWPSVKYDDIYFVMEDFYIDGDPDSDMRPSQIELSTLTKANDYDSAVYAEYSSYGIPMYKLVYKSTESVRNAMFYIPPFDLNNPASMHIKPEKSWLSASPGEGGSSDVPRPYIHVFMSDDAKFASDGKNGTLVITCSGEPVFVLVCVRDFINE